MKKNKKRLLSFLVALSFVLTSFGFADMYVYAERIASDASIDDNVVEVLNEGFAGEGKNAYPSTEGWLLTRNGQIATQIGGYSSEGNYGEAAPALGFGRSGKGEEILESPEFCLKADGKLSFYHKPSAGQNEMTSTLKIEVLENGIWNEIEGFNILEEGIFSIAISKEVTKVKFTFNKAVGNLVFDDVKVSYDINDLEKEEDIIDIKDARNSSEDEEIKIRGVVSFNDRNSTLHIEDATGAIAVYKNDLDFSSIKAGDYIQVIGTKGSFKGMAQLSAKEVNIVVEGKGMPAAKPVSIEELNKGNYDSQYVEIKNAVFDKSAKTLTQGSDVLNIYYIPSDINVETGDVVDVKGTMGSYSGTVQIYGSSCTFTKIENADLTAPVIQHEVIEKAPIDADLTINAKVTDNVEVKSVSLFYKIKGTELYTEVAMDNTSEDIYSAIIAKEDLSIAGIEYYIESLDGSNKAKSGIYTINITKDDMVGPAINDLVPAKNSSVGTEGKPEISVSLKDKTGVNVESIKIYVDSVDVTKNAEIDENSIKYIPNAELKDGNHQVKIEAADILGNVSTVEWTFRKGKINHYFGQLHSHTNISDGAGSLEDAYKWARDNGADYLAVTDHSNWFDNDTSADINNGSASTEWVGAHNTADKYNEENEFSAIYGYEMTWSGSTGGWGHINTFNTDGFETRSNSAMDLSNYYSTISGVTDSLSQLNHPGKTFGDFADFGYYSKAVDDVVYLVEVGNGEGAIGGSGYFPSYEYYTRALDKGWHVAPSNNQDNHKGKWYTSNTARTVILAEENTRESLYDAIRNLRVYASEDTNMVVDYSVNGNEMGSILEEAPEKLKIKVSVSDEDKNDKIQRISIIANGGTEVISKEFNQEEVSWDLELNPEYSYYYAKIVQKDGQIAVTSPVWVGESVNVGLKEAKVDNELTLPNEKVAISLGVYNNSSEVIENTKIEYFENEINDNNKIGEEVIDSIGVNESKDISYTWIPKKAGEYKIYAKVTISAAGSEKVFTTSAKVTVANPAETYKVMIDGAHYNQYVSGNYAGNYTALKEKLNAKNAVAILNKEEITKEMLKDVDLLVLTNPQSRDKASSGLYASKFQTTEIEAIKEFVDNGGNIILTTIADYGDGTEEYSNNAQMNPILEAIGTELRINDDQVIDETLNGGQTYRLYFNKYSSDNYNLVDGIENGISEFSFYSGASVILAEGAAGNNVDFIVNGHETTKTQDADNQGDNIAVEEGKVSVLGAEELSNGSKVVVGGNTFFSDFETSGNSADTYSNAKILDNILNWMLPEKEIKRAKINELRVDQDNDGIPDLLGEKYIIEGYVTAQSEAVAPKNAFFEVIYVEDETGGICVFGVSNTELKVGQKVRITGKVDEYQGEFEIQISNEETDVEIIEEDQTEIKPSKLSTYDSMQPINGGKLVKVQGKVTKMDEANLYLDDGTGVSRAYVEGYIWDGEDEATKGKWSSDINIGDTVSVIGLASMDPEGARLRVRNTGEIIKVDEEINSEPVIDNPEEDNNKPAKPNENRPNTDNEDKNPQNNEDEKPENNQNKNPGNNEDKKPIDNGQEKVDEIVSNENNDQKVENGNNSLVNNSPNNQENDENRENTTNKIPNTGGVNSGIYIALALVVIAGGVILLSKKNKK